MHTSPWKGGRARAARCPARGRAAGSERGRGRVVRVPRLRARLAGRARVRAHPCAPPSLDRSRATLCCPSCFRKHATVCPRGTTRAPVRPIETGVICVVRKQDRGPSCATRVACVVPAWHPPARATCRPPRRARVWPRACAAPRACAVMAQPPLARRRPPGETERNSATKKKKKGALEFAPSRLRAHSFRWPNARSGRSETRARPPA